MTPRKTKSFCTPIPLQSIHGVGTMQGSSSACILFLFIFLWPQLTAALTRARRMPTFQLDLILKAETRGSEFATIRWYNNKRSNSFQEVSVPQIDRVTLEENDKLAFVCVVAFYDGLSDALETLDKLVSSPWPKSVQKILLIGEEPIESSRQLLELSSSYSLAIHSTSGHKGTVKVFFFVFLGQMRQKLVPGIRTEHCPGRKPSRSFHFWSGETPIHFPECQDLLRGQSMTASFFGPKPNILIRPDGYPTGGDLETLRIVTDKMGAAVDFKVSFTVTSTYLLIHNSFFSKKRLATPRTGLSYSAPWERSSTERLSLPSGTSP